MGYSTAGKNLMLNALRGTAPAAPITHVSLHTNDPGDNGANEVAGGAPAYARRPIAFNAPAAGSMDDSSNGIAFDVPAGTTVRFVGYWSALAAGTYLGSSPITNETFAGQGVYNLTDADLDLNAV